MNTVTPSIHKKSFSCPRCGAHADQTWFSTHACELNDIPSVWDIASLNERLNSIDEIEEEIREEAKKYFEKIKLRLAREHLYLDDDRKDPYSYSIIYLNISKCHSCKKISVWLHDKLIYPEAVTGIKPNSDLPEDIQTDFNEALAIYNKSPRGAAALMRLCIEKLCNHVGAQGDKLHQKIEYLHNNGLDEKSYKALHIVKVVGNESVHPGELDLKDDHKMAENLFHLVNVMADSLISHGKKLENMWQDLPESKRKEIDAKLAKTKA